ncbi:MAG: hypothetical protein EPN86_03650 [Nanoarchaeota archaeon]|nr:MAG: hypothetical protein EPN86_03650 [Nanoarchaeota archaeon]
MPKVANLMNKKGDMVLSFGIGIILALIVFIPLCAYLSRSVRLSDSAEISFNDMVNKLNSLTVGDGPSHISVELDKNTRIIAFPATQVPPSLEQEPECKLKPNIVARPPSCPEGKSCLCRCKKVETDKLDKCSDDVCKEIDNVYGVGMAIDREEGFPLDDFDTSSSELSSCSYQLRSERIHFIYAEKTASGITFCQQLDNGKCVPEALKTKEELTQKLSATIPKAFLNCNSRLGGQCSCGTFDASAVPAGATLKFSAAKSDSGADIMQFDVVDHAGNEMLASPQTIPVKFCTFNLNTKQDGEQPSEMTKNVGDTPAWTPKDTVFDYYKQNTNMPMLVRIADKVCIATNDQNTPYLYDMKTGGIFTNAGDFVITQECIYST